MSENDRTFVPSEGSDFDKPTLLSTESGAPVSQQDASVHELNIPGYDVIEEIARGGMGRILRAIDITLEREVALKILLAGAPASRFIRESKITARLNHPGIPPIHAMGTLDSGESYLAMRLVVGHTMAKEMESEQSSLLEIFYQVCHAVGYAHSKGIIHRDLKPANVMVGEFGEVQVMDWGLARDLSDTDPEDLSPGESGSESNTVVAPNLAGSAVDSKSSGIRRTPHSSARDVTVLGSVMGTPSYMAPEQARGEPTDQRADVFSLGAMLCEILTGSPPFVGTSAVGLIQQAATGKLSEALLRLDTCSADKDLVDLCKACLSPERDKRPKNAGEIQDILTRYRVHQDERLKSAERERAVAETRLAEQRKRRRVLRLLGVVILLTLIAGTFGLLRFREDALIRKSQIARMNDSFEILLKQARTALMLGETDEASLLLSDAANQTDDSIRPEHLDELKSLESDLALSHELNAIYEYRWTPIDNQLPSLDQTANRIHEGLGKYGLLSDATSTVARIKASAVREQLIGMLDRLQLIRPSLLVRDILFAVDEDAFRTRLRRAILQKHWDLMKELASSPEFLKQPPLLISILGDAGALPMDLRRSVLKSAIVDRPSDSTLLLSLASTYSQRDPKEVSEAIRWFQAGIAVSPKSSAVRCNLGSALRRNGDLEGAKVEFQKAIEYMPENVNGHLGIGLVEKQLGNVKASIEAFEKARTIAPGNIHALNGLASSLAAYGDAERASKLLHEVLTIDPNDKYALTGVPVIDKAAERAAKLPDVATGKLVPESPTEALEFARIASRPAHGRIRLAARLTENSITSFPEWAKDVRAGYRYDGACYAAKAAAIPDTSEGGTLPDPPERQRLRGLALQWLNEDLATMKTPGLDAATRTAYRERLEQSLHDSDLQSVRSGADRSDWTAEEVSSWDTYWADVANTAATLAAP